MQPRRESHARPVSHTLGHVRETLARAARRDARAVRLWRPMPRATQQALRAGAAGSAATLALLALFPFSPLWGLEAEPEPEAEAAAANAAANAAGSGPGAAVSLAPRSAPSGGIRGCSFAPFVCLFCDAVSRRPPPRQESPRQGCPHGPQSKHPPAPPPAANTLT